MSGGQHRLQKIFRSRSSLLRFDAGLLLGIRWLSMTNVNRCWPDKNGGLQATGDARHMDGRSITDRLARSEGAWRS